MKNKKLIGADVLLKSLIKENTEIIFGYPGGVTIPLHDRLKDYPKIKHVLPRNEQACALAADAYFRVKGKVAVCLSTSGPGATNLVTGIANAYMDSIGMIVITCQVAKPLVGTDAFQEVDIIGITQPIVKHSYFVENVSDIPRIVKEAFSLAVQGRPRPVHIDIPADVLKEVFDDKFVYPENKEISKLPAIKESQVIKLVNLINQSKSPIIIAGHGVILSDAVKDLKLLVEKINIPVTTTLLGIGVIDERNSLSLGMLGMHGMGWANRAVDESDLIIGIGVRFNDRITGKVSEFAKNAKIVHIDIDRAELGKIIKPNIAIHSDAKIAIREISKRIKSKKHSDWINQIKLWQKEYNFQKIQKASRVNKKDNKFLSAQNVIEEIYNVTKNKKVIISSDVGQNQMWTAQFYKYSKNKKLLSSGGLGTMGYSLPAAIGAAFANPKDQVWAIMGDGGAQMNVQELGTIMENKLPIKIVILNNSYLGMVRQWQELFYGKNYAATPMKNPNFKKIADAYNIKAYNINNEKGLKDRIKEAALSEESILLEIKIGKEDIVLPMIAPGAPITSIIKSRKDI